MYYFFESGAVQVHIAPINLGKHPLLLRRARDSRHSLGPHPAFSLARFSPDEELLGAFCLINVSQKQNDTPMPNVLAGHT